MKVDKKEGIMKHVMLSAAKHLGPQRTNRLARKMLRCAQHDMTISSAIRHYG